MTRKPGSMYRYIKQQANTRREYMGGIPSSRITQFIMGNKKSNFPFNLSLVSIENCHIRHNALESARITANKSFEKNISHKDTRTLSRDRLVALQRSENEI